MTHAANHFTRDGSRGGARDSQDGKNNREIPQSSNLGYDTPIHRLNKKNTPAASLRELAGGWSDEDAVKLLDSIKPCEQIDEEMWA